ncbi:MAG: EAL domain-containing protein [Candidatus Brocadiaceae bacterium]|nr:EAL domain-containing protein [Candidatus Brocadiaceae bacterium]
MKILIVDDTEEIRDVLRLFIEKLGHEIIEAVDGQDGFEKAKIHKPGLIITDAMMPKVDGFTLLRNIKMDPSLRSIPCVFYSAIYTDSKDRALALSLGAEAFIEKPKTLDELWEKIQTILERKKQPAAQIEKRMIDDEKEFLKSHSQTVVEKLEEKVKELEKVIAENKQMEDSLQKSEASLANAQRIARLGNWEWNIVTNELRWSDEIYRIFGLTPQEFDATYEAFLNSVHPDDREFVKKSVNDALYERMPYSIDHRIVLPDGSERTAHEQAEVVFDSTGKAIQMNGTVQDVTERKRAEEEIKRLFTAIDQSINNVFITDVKGRIEYVNSTFEQVTGYAKEEAIGQNPRILASGETTHAEYEEFWRTILAGKTWRGIFKNKKKNGHYYWGNGLITPIRNEKGQITHFLAVQEDITEKMQTEERAKYLASHDELTGILNRTCFMEQLNEWLSHNKDYNQTGVLLLIDIDGFRLINDTYGHSTGDNVLHHVAVFLTNTLFEMDKHYVNRAVKESILSRLGGDEFAIFLPDRDEKEGMETAEEIRKRLEKSRFVEVPGHVTTSIGVAIYPRDGSMTKELLTKADASIYHAKELGHNRIHLYNTEDLVLEKIRSRMEWKGRIQKAIDEDRFEPWFQPILVLKDNQVHHYEALARMRDTNGEVILPWAFVDTAETFGLITAIDRIIINKTLQTQSNLCKQGKVLSFSMNLSGKDLGDKEILQFLKSAIIETGADPRFLIFEITETAAIRDLDRAIKFIRELKATGCSFALDDFGVGFTSFKYLREMEVDYIKIDGVFIRTLHETTNDHIFVKAIADVARGMGIKTIAEFVENNEIIKILKEYGVDYGQGYFIGKPSPEV